MGSILYKVPTVIFIVGQTASGKTAASLALSEFWPIEIINADSRQVYRGMDIGTAKVTETELQIAPHHLIDIVQPDEQFNVAMFLQQAKLAITDISSRGKLPVVVGGTGQYIWGLIEGWEIPEVPPQIEFRRQMEQEVLTRGTQALYDQLFQIDPTAARSIGIQNGRRLIRALEVWEKTHIPFSRQKRRSPPSYTPVVFGIRVPKLALHKRIETRTGIMIENGWVKEVSRLLDSDYHPNLPSFSSAGYREIAAHVNGEIDLETGRALIVTAVKKLARKQASWFKPNDPRITWVDSFDEISKHIERLGDIGVIQSAEHLK